MLLYLEIFISCRGHPLVEPIIAIILLHLSICFYYHGVWTWFGLDWR